MQALQARTSPAKLLGGTPASTCPASCDALAAACRQRRNGVTLEYCKLRQALQRTCCALRRASIVRALAHGKARRSPGAKNALFSGGDTNGRHPKHRQRGGDSGAGRPAGGSSLGSDPRMRSHHESNHCDSSTTAPVTQQRLEASRGAVIGWASAVHGDCFRL